MYNVHELRNNIKQALDRAIISPVKVLRGKNEVFYILSDKQFKALQVAKIVQQQRESHVQAPNEPVIDYSNSQL